MDATYNIYLRNFMFLVVYNWIFIIRKLRKNLKKNKTIKSIINVDLSSDDDDVHSWLDVFFERELLRFKNNFLRN